ncbi:MAG TPA: Calx-beta domain-containing protein [Acidimicrobiales bacterium]|nr:Calx-beta domain-containing protein [Acidimicrobiales bacterium]
MTHSRLRVCCRSLLAALVATASLAALVAVGQSPAAADPVTTVKGEACSYVVKVGLFGGPQGTAGCNEGINGDNSGTPRAPQGGTDPFPSDTSYSPHVRLPADGSGGSMSASDSNGASGVYGPAKIHGGLWPCEAPGTDPNGDGYVGNCLSSPPPSGPQNASTEGSTSLGTVTSAAEINLRPTPIPIPCYGGPSGGYGPNCADRGGYGPFPVSGDSMHVECSANGSAVSGSATFSRATTAHSTDGDGSPLDEEPVPDNPPANYTEHGVITNVGDVFTVVYNEQIHNADGSLTVIGTHMYLFGPVAIGEVRRGEVTCGTDQSAPVADTLAPSCGTPVVKPMGPEDPTPQSPRSELVGTFDARGLQSVTNLEVNEPGPADDTGTVKIGEPEFLPYRQFVPGQTGPLQVTATRTDEAEAARLPMHWSFDVTDMAGNTSHCVGFEGGPNANDDAFSAEANTTSTFIAPGVLANDTEGNDDPLTLGAPSAPAHGSVNLHPDGSFTYTANPGYFGTDTFTYVVDDGRGLSDTATVTLTVGTPPPTELRIDDVFQHPTEGGGTTGASEGGDGTTTAYDFTVVRTGSTASVSTVQYKASGGSATSGTDYTAVPLQTLTFNPGETLKTITVNALGDSVNEKNETFNVVLSGAKNAYVTDNIGVGTIFNDDWPSYLRVDSVTVAEGNTSTTPVDFVIHRSNNLDATTIVSYKTSGGTAIAGTDYAAVAPNSVTFAPGEDTKTVTTNVTGDTADEKNETFNLVLSAPVAGTLADASGTATIVDDEGPITPGPATFFSVDGDAFSEDASFAYFIVNRTGDTTGTSTVKYKIGGGTATAGTDYTADPATGTVTFGPDETQQFLTFWDLASIDTTVEPDETFNMTLSSPTGGVIADASATWTLQNDDVPASLTINDPYVNEGNSGTTEATFTITRARNVDIETKVKYSTKTAPSAEADDFTAVPLTEVIFAPGETTKTVTVNVTGDTAREYNERFTLALSAPVGATLSDATGTALIINDD